MTEALRGLELGDASYVGEIEGDPYIWVEPFRDLTLEEFRARERIKFERAEAERLAAKDKLEEALRKVKLGSMVRTSDGKNWIVQETKDGRRVLLTDRRARKARRAQEKKEGTTRL